MADKLLSTIKTFDLVRDVLPAAVKYVPLVANECSVAYLPFCAKSEAEFLDWNVGKQRAAEVWFFNLSSIRCWSMSVTTK